MRNVHCIGLRTRRTHTMSSTNRVELTHTIFNKAYIPPVTTYKAVQSWGSVVWIGLTKLIALATSIGTSNKKLSYRRGTARCVLSVVILPITTQQCRNYLYDKSWRNWWYEVGGLAGGNVYHKQTDDGRVVYITCIPTTCCGEIF